jgi:hypothetical protein
MPDSGGSSTLHQTLKNVCIFILFLIAVLLWDDARPHLRSIIPRFHRAALTLFLWSTGVVILFHALYVYAGKCGARAVYIITGLATVAAMIYYDLIDLF